MAGFPKEGNIHEIGHVRKNLPDPFPCLRAVFHNEGPGRNKFCGKTIVSRLAGSTEERCRAIRVRSVEAKRKYRTGRPSLESARILSGSCWGGARHDLLYC